MEKWVTHKSGENVQALVLEVREKERERTLFQCLLGVRVEKREREKRAPPSYLNVT